MVCFRVRKIEIQQHKQENSVYANLEGMRAMNSSPDGQSFSL